MNWRSDDRLRVFLRLLMCLLAAAAVKPAQSQSHSTEYLREFPPAERVLADFRGKDSLDTAKRQIGALMRLRTMLKQMWLGGEYHGRGTPEEAALFNSYNEAMKKPYEGLGAEEQKQLHLYRQDQSLDGSRDKAIEREVLSRYFSKEWQAKYSRTVAAEQTRIQEAREARSRPDLGKRTVTLIEILIGVAFIALIVLKFGRRILGFFGPRMVTCESCGKPMSASAYGCPSCGTPRPSATTAEAARLSLRPCRICGEMLDEKVHRPLSTRDEVITTPTTAHTTFYGASAFTTISEGMRLPIKVLQVNHIPCTKCGEPRPVRRMVDIGIINFFVGSFLFFNYFLGPILIALIGLKLDSYTIAIGASLLYLVGFWKLSDKLYR